MMDLKNKELVDLLVDTIKEKQDRLADKFFEGIDVLHKKAELEMATSRMICVVTIKEMLACSWQLSIKD